jgi:mannonate dehydratase
MKEGWRWYGDSDQITLKEIRQAGTTDVVAAIYERKPGEVWTVEEIKERADKVAAAGMTWSVVESVPIHEDIKKHTGNWRKYVENYKTTLRNLAKCGIKTVCYNFMPVLDWTRTDLNQILPDGTGVLAYNCFEVTAFDLFRLKRPGAEKEYPERVKRRAKALWDAASAKDRKRIEKAILTGLPGTVDDLTPRQFLAQLKKYEGITEKDLRNNLYGFLNEITPVLEETGINMAIHPDDPPYPIFGLPRILSSAKDIRRMFKECPSPHIGLTLCTGSLGGSLWNDEVAIFKEFASRVYFLHLRNLQYTEPGVFRESDSHLRGKVNMTDLVKEILKEEHRRGEPIVMRADHGRFMEIDKFRKCYGGYTYGGLLVGLSELRGLEFGIKHWMNID